MKRFGYAVLLAAAGAIALAQQTAARDLVFGSALPPKHNVNTQGLAPTFEALAKATGGKLKWKLLTGGQLFGLRASLTNVGGGVADGAIIIPSFVQSKIPHVYTITDMSLFAEDPLVAAGASAETIFHDCPECLADFRKQKAVPLGFYGLNTYKLLCNTKVTNLAEVKGKRMRTSGAAGRWARAMGGTPVSMSGSDMIEALQRGQIDCAIGPLAWVKAYSIGEHIKYVLDFPMGNFAAAAHFVMNRGAWDALIARTQEGDDRRHAVVERDDHDGRATPWTRKSASTWCSRRAACSPRAARSSPTFGRTTSGKSWTP